MGQSAPVSLSGKILMGQRTQTLCCPCPSLILMLPMSKPYFHLLQTLVHYSEQPVGLSEEVQGG